jgi:hypothetical protein
VRTPAIAANFLSLAERAVKENHTHIRYLEALLALECEERDRHAIDNRIRRFTAAANENAGGVRLRAGASDPGGEDP